MADDHQPAVLRLTLVYSGISQENLGGEISVAVGKQPSFLALLNA